MARTKHRKGQIVDDSENSSEWILRSMVAMAASDGRLDDREIAIIQRTYHELTAKELTADDIRHASGATAKGDDILGELRRVSGQLSTPTKEGIIQGVYMVLLADENIAGEERKRLKDIANSLGIDEIHLGTILEDLAVRLAGRTA
jgi:uncharacterized tellurite resistance protein B-like protein